MRIERFWLAGPAGPLEALLEFEPDASPRASAVVCHPHPLYGGTMHNKVVFRIAKATLSLGLPTLRFNFRGAGKSAGNYDNGRGERDDVRAALGFLRARFPGLPVIVAGFSFGSWVALAVGARDPNVRALVGVGLPVGSSPFTFLLGVKKPKLIVQATEDQFGPREKLQALFDSLDEPKRLRWVEGADHFFGARVDEVRQAVSDFLREVVATNP
jgi:uncharacterized protein